MGSRAADLRFVEHRAFGPGVVFGSRIADSGEAGDTWFVRDEKLRVVLIESLAESTEPELSKAQRKALRSAHRDYRKAHVKRARQTPKKPRLKRAFRDRLFKAELRHVSRGDDPAATDSDEGLAAD